MGFGVVFTMLAFLFIFAGMTVAVMHSQQTLTAATTTIKEEQKKLVEQNNQEITITSDAYSTNQFQDWEVTYQTDFTQGTFANTTTVGDQVELLDSELAGSYTSVAYDTGATSNFSTINFNTLLPGGTTLEFQVRTANDESTLLASSFIGPDGTSGTYYTVTGSSLHSSHNLSRWIQWRAYYTTLAAGTSAELYDLTIPIQRQSGHADLQVENTGGSKLVIEETDVYVDGIRLPRNGAGRLLDCQDVVDTHLWNPGENCNITIIANISGSALITVTNEYAQDQEVVP